MTTSQPPASPVTPKQIRNVANLLAIIEEMPQTAALLRKFADAFKALMEEYNTLREKLAEIEREMGTYRVPDLSTVSSICLMVQELRLRERRIAERDAAIVRAEQAEARAEKAEQALARLHEAARAMILGISIHNERRLNGPIIGPVVDDLHTAVQAAQPPAEVAKPTDEAEQRLAKMRDAGHVVQSDSEAQAIFDQTITAMERDTQAGDAKPAEQAGEP